MPPTILPPPLVLISRSRFSQLVERNSNLQYGTQLDRRGSGH
nr:hypothetical protein Iba_chr04bCG10960 [Ipomoea batatas]GMD44380.1 hypothetical protein Iba_scaffold45908CG0010 [Ipomoea batatas]